jgi:formamidopyrimidine-DNA glycosylase
MPELPEVETVVRGLRPHLVGALISDVTATVERLRTRVDLPSLREVCCGRTIRAVRRRAKFIVVELDGGVGMVLHLGMTGAFRIVPPETPLTAYDRVAWRLADGRSWRFLDVRRFGSVQACALPPDGQAPALLAGLGPEPLEADFDGAFLYAATRGRARPVKNLIMDQAVVVGVGNIYASEALFRAELSPKRHSASLSRAAADRLAAAIKAVLLEAIAAGGTTIGDFRHVDGSEGEFAVNLNVYGRKGLDCLRCGLPAGIRRIVQGGRASFFCPRCQR